MEIVGGIREAVGSFVRSVARRIEGLPSEREIKEIEEALSKVKGNWNEVREEIERIMKEKEYTLVSACLYNTRTFNKRKAQISISIVLKGEVYHAKLSKVASIR